MSAPQVADEMVARFLAWKLPQDFSPDCHIRFDREAADAGSWPMGTNLLNAIQARAMLKHVLEIAPGPDLLAGPLDFGDAIRALKAGKRVARAGWNGKGMWLVMVASDGWTVPNKNYVSHPEFDGEPHLLPWIGMKTADNGFVPWLASQTDILATDWVVL